MHGSEDGSEDGGGTVALKKRARAKFAPLLARLRGGDVDGGEGGDSRCRPAAEL